MRLLWWQGNRLYCFVQIWVFRIDKWTDSIVKIFYMHGTRANCILQICDICDDKWANCIVQICDICDDKWADCIVQICDICIDKWTDWFVQICDICDDKWADCIVQICDICDDKWADCIVQICDISDAKWAYCIVQICDISDAKWADCIVLYQYMALWRSLTFPLQVVMTNGQTVLSCTDLLMLLAKVQWFSQSRLDYTIYMALSNIARTWPGTSDWYTHWNFVSEWANLWRKVYVKMLEGAIYQGWASGFLP